MVQITPPQEERQAPRGSVQPSGWAAWLFGPGIRWIGFGKNLSGLEVQILQMSSRDVGPPRVLIRCARLQAAIWCRSDRGHASVWRPRPRRSCRSASAGNGWCCRFPGCLGRRGNRLAGGGRVTFAAGLMPDDRGAGDCPDRQRCRVSDCAAATARRSVRRSRHPGSSRPRQAG